MAAQSLLQEYSVLGCGARRAIWSSGSRMVFARPQSSLGSIATVTAGPEQRALRFGVGRLPYCSQLPIAGRKVTTGAAAVSLVLSHVSICAPIAQIVCLGPSPRGVGSVWQCCNY